MLTRMDSDIGRLMAALKRKGLDENTLVIFTSDNGPAPLSSKLLKSSGPLRGVKRDMYESGIRVPFIARWTGKIKPGATTDQVIAFWDLLPTACEIAGVKAPSGIDGISYLPALLGKPLEIFNLRDDPGEQREMAASHPEIVAKMEQIIKTAHTPSTIWPVQKK